MVKIKPQKKTKSPVDIIQIKQNICDDFECIKKKDKNPHRKIQYL